MGEMSPETDRRHDGSGWLLAIVLIGLVAAIGIGGTLWGYSATRRASEMAVMMQLQAEQMRGRAEQATERAESESRRAEEQSARASTAEQAVRTQEQRVEAISEFVRETLVAADSAKGQDPSAEVRSALDQAAARLENGAIADLNTAASLHSSLGMAYHALGDAVNAQKHLRAAVELRKQAKGESSPEVSADLENLAKVTGTPGK